MPESSAPAVVSRAEWLPARLELLAAEKELNAQRDTLSAQRRRLPAVRVDQSYTFEGPDGPLSLLDLFGPHPQLIVYHFMFEPTWDEGCPSCSLFADNFDGSVAHLAARDTAFVVVSRAPLHKLSAFQQRMGWRFPWVSSGDSSFNQDFHVTLDTAAGSTEYNYQDAETLRRAGKIWVVDGDLPGISAFLRHGDDVLHTYSTYQHGIDPLMMTYNFLDLTPLGRHEDDLAWPMAWVRHHDRYAQ